MGNAPLLSKELFRKGASKGIKASDLDDNIASTWGRRGGVTSASPMPSRRRSTNDKYEISGNPIKGLVSKMVTKYLGAISNVSDKIENKDIGAKLSTLSEDAGNFGADNEDTKNAASKTAYERMGMDPREH